MTEPIPNQTSLQMLRRRKLLWSVFWLLFISTPATVIFIPVLLEYVPQADLLHDYGLVETASSLLAGSFATAFILGKLRGASKGQFIAITMLCTVLFAILFGMISYVGCKVVIKW